MAFRRRRPRSPVDAVDPLAVPVGYRPAVTDALRARDQFAELAATLRPGPLQDRMSGLGERVDAGVLAVWRTATHAGQLERVVGGLDPERVTDELKQARRSGASQEVVDALSARFASTQRLLNALDGLRERLPVLEARLATAVARAAELTLVSPSSPMNDEVAALESELDGVVLELDALTQASGELA